MVMITSSRLCRLRSLVGLLLCVICALANAQDDQDPDDPHVQRDGEGLDFDREFLSPPTLTHPIYACANTATVKNYRKGALIEVFIDDALAPTGPVIGVVPTLGVRIDLGTTLVEGQKLHAIQSIDGATSGPSNTITVTSHTEDYRDGLPRPRLWRNPLRNCGAAVLVEDVVPGSSVSVFSEASLGSGMFDPPIDVGGFSASTEWGHNWTPVNPRFKLDERVTAQAELCSDVSRVSLPEIVIPEPVPMPPGSLARPLIAGATEIAVQGKDNTPDPSDALEHGVVVRVYEDGSKIAESPAPGGVRHIFGISSPISSSRSYTATQELCLEGPPGEPQMPMRCEELSAAVIAQPLPGDTVVRVLKSVLGARIVVFADGEEIGDSGGNEINLSRPLAAGEEIRVVQQLGDCQSEFVYVIEVECPFGDAPNACGGEWPAFRQSGVRHAQQTLSGPLADPYKVKQLEVRSSFTAPDGGAFTASPVVSGDKVFIGSSRGHLYALDADSLDLLWQFPPEGDPALLSEWAERDDSEAPCANPSSHGIAASVTVATLEGDQNVVILGAPDRGRPSDLNGKFDQGLGSGRLFALDPDTGDPLWMSREPVARLTGTDEGSITEFHEQIGYSSPLVQGGRIFVGIGDHCDNPIQKGRVVSSSLFTGAIDGSFSFESVSDGDPNIDRGGGIWTYLSGGPDGGLFTTTGNTRRTATEPTVNHGLSMIRLDPATGALQGKIQPVPFEQDGDPDWAAGVTLGTTSCGPLAMSVMKDGWAYAAETGPPLDLRWQFPNTAFPFPVDDPNSHGDIRYHRAGATWNDVFVAMMGGEDIVSHDTTADIYAGYRRLHALNVCASTGSRVRWIAELEPYTLEPPEGGSTHYWGLGPVSVSHGIIYIGTNRGMLLAIADPSVWPAQGSRCTWSFIDESLCVANGFQLVPRPTILKAIELGGSMQRNEPVLAKGRIYMANSVGQLFLISAE